MYVSENLWQELPKATGGFGAFTPEGAWVPGPPVPGVSVPSPWCPIRRKLPKATGGFGRVNVEKQFPNQILPSRMNPVGRWGPVVGRYSLVSPQHIMWETPVSSPMSTDKAAEAKVWAEMGGFGQMPSTGEVAAIGAASLVLWGLSIIFIGGVVIWVARSIRKD